MSARAWARVWASSEDFHRRRVNGDPTPATRIAVPPFDWATVQNNSGHDCRRGEVLEFDPTGSPLLDDLVADDGVAWLKGVTPDTTRPGFAILNEDVPDGDFDLHAIVLGACFALVTVNDASHKYADVVSGSRVLSSATTGPVRILYKPTGTGEKKCKVLLGGVSTPSTLIIENKSGSTMPSGGLGRITNNTYSNGVLTVEIGKPNTAFQRQYVVNTGADIANNAKGPGSWLDEGGVVGFDAGTPVIGDTMGAHDGSWFLRKGGYGFEVIGSAGMIGSTNLSYCRQQIVNEIACKPSGTISKGGTGAVTVWWRNSGTGAWETASMTLTARALGLAVTSALWAKARWECGELLVGPWEC